MKKLILLLLVVSQSIISIAPEQPLDSSKEKPKLTQAQKYSLIGLGAAAIVGATFFGGRKAYHYHLANKPDKDGKLPLIKAIRDVATYNFIHKNDLIDQFGPGLDDLKKLIDWGAKINVVDNDGVAPLTLSVILNQPKITTILLENGAKVDLQKKQTSDTALSEAVVLGRIDMVKLLINGGANPNLGKDKGNAVFEAISKDKIMALYILNNSKVAIDVNARNEKGDIPLIAACRLGLVEVVEKLLELGSDVDAKNNNTNETARFVIERNLNLSSETYTSIKILFLRWVEKLSINKPLNT